MSKVQLIIILFFSTISICAFASEKPASARDTFASATDSYNSGNYSNALEQFKEAYNLRPSFKILFNIAQTHIELNQLGLALDNFEKYIEDGGDELLPKRRSAVIKEIKRLRGKVGEIVVHGQLGAEFRIDSVHKGYLPLENPVRLNVGNHTLELLLQGRPVCVEKIEIIAGKKRIQRCNDPSLSSEGPIADKVKWDDMSSNIYLGKNEGVDIDIKGDRKNFFDVAFIPTASLSATTLTIGIITAISTSNLNSKLQGACINNICDSSQQDDMDKLKKRAAFADVMFVSTALFATAATVFFIIKKKKEK